MATQAAIDNLRLLFPELPGELLGLLADSWVEDGDNQRAFAEMRRSAVYDRYFPGNRRDDGSVRMDEKTYASYREFYDRTLVSVGVNPDVFGEQFARLVEGEVSPQEFGSRVDAAYGELLSAAPELRQWYAEVNQLGMTDEALLASYLDPNVGQAVLDRRIDLAQIAATGEMRGFDISLDLATRLVDFGVTAQQAGSTFGEGVELVPIVNALARRHFDPDDDFDVNEFAAATLLDDPFERRRMRRLIAQESALYRSGTSIARNRTGGSAGLRAL